MFSVITDDLQELWFFLKKTIPLLDLKHQHVFTIKKYWKPRTIKMNRTYWMHITLLSEEIGDDSPEDTHESLARHFLPWKLKHAAGMDYYERTRTPNTDTEEFNQYHLKVHRHAIDFHGVHLPWPGESGWDEFLEKYYSRSNRPLK